MSRGQPRIARRPLPDGGAAHALPAGLSPLLARVYLARNVRRADELDHGFARLLPPDGLKGMDQAVALLQQAVERGERILVVADFDADGATSCALALRALRLLGAADARFIVPNRFDYGYGLTPEIVTLAAEQAPSLIITVDNGISSVDGVAAARARGIDVLVTDHHLPGERLPDANAMVNPNQPGDGFTSKHLAGVGVIFYVMLALRARLRADGWFERRGLTEPNLAQLLDLVALGTVADVVPLDHNNRVLVAQGLARINSGRACAGIQALLAVAGRRAGRVTASDLGFVVGPRLNAAGRMDDMSLGIRCLLSDDPGEAGGLAARLDVLNRERRSVQDDMQAQAVAAADTLRLEEGALPRGLCLFDESWHQGVIGLVASRLKERLHRPVIAFAPADANELKGSARSVPGLHIRDALDAVAARHPELLRKFGGHAMAAGMSLKREHYDDFARAFDAEVSRHLREEDLQALILSDGPLAATELNLESAELLRAGGPWGQGFPEPLFDDEFEVVQQRVVGDRHLKLVLRHADDVIVDAIAFNHAPEGRAPRWPRVHAVYRMDVNDYQGRRTLQLVIEYLHSAGN